MTPSRPLSPSHIDATKAIKKKPFALINNPYANRKNRKLPTGVKRPPLQSKPDQNASKHADGARPATAAPSVTTSATLNVTSKKPVSKENASNPVPVRPQSIKTKYKQEIQALKRAKLAHERRLQEEKQLRQLAKERKKVEQELQKLKKEQEEKQLELLQTQREQQGHPLATIPQGLARANPSIQTTYPPKPIIPAVANCFNNYQRSPALPTLPLSAIPSLMSGAINAYSTITAPSISSGVSPTSTTTAPTPSLSKDSAHPSTTHWVRPSPVGPETKPPPPPTPPTQESLRSHEGEPSPSDQTVKTSNHRRNGSLPAFAAAAGGMTSMATQYVTPLPNVKTLPVVTHHHDEPSQLPANAPTMTGPPLATSPESSGSLVDGPADAPEPVVKRQEIHPSLATSVAQQGVNKNSYIPSGGAGAASILVATAFGGGGGDARPSDGTMVATALKQYSQQTLPHSTQAYLTEQPSAPASQSLTCLPSTDHIAPAAMPCQTAQGSFPQNGWSNQALGVVGASSSYHQQQMLMGQQQQQMYWNHQQSFPYHF